jgi:hypothetical protein
VLFPIVAVLAFIVLRLSTRLRMKTLLWLSLVIGLAADWGTDLLVILGR